MKSNHRCSSDPLFFSMTYDFLQVYLPRQCGRSLHTVESYRDSLSLFRRYIVNNVGISIGQFSFAQCTRECVLGFMDYLSERNSKPSTRNQRLAALKSYLTFAADKDITLQSNELEIRRVPQCRVSKTEKTVIREDGMAAILRQPPNTKMGLRDRTIMVLLYDSGARLAEVLALHVSDVVVGSDNPYIRVNGKGSKQRIVPISVKTAQHLAHYISVYHTKEWLKTNLLFYTVIKSEVGMMSEGNVERFVREYARKARSSCPSIPDHVHPHMFRRYVERRNMGSDSHFLLYWIRGSSETLPILFGLAQRPQPFHQTIVLFPFREITGKTVWICGFQSDALLLTVCPGIYFGGANMRMPEEITNVKQGDIRLNHSHSLGMTDHMGCYRKIDIEPGVIPG